MMRAHSTRAISSASALLGAVSSVNAAGDGFQFQQAAFGAQVINYNLFTYYIRLNMYHQPSAAGAIASVIALDVSLSQYCATF